MGLIDITTKDSTGFERTMSNCVWGVYTDQEWTEEQKLQGNVLRENWTYYS